MKILVAVCTVDRVKQLDRCLRALRRVTVPEGTDVAARVVVNRRSGTRFTEAMVGAHANLAPFPVKAVVEPEPGIAHARNRALEEAISGGFTHLAFVDDDAWPEPGWLEALAARMDGRYAAVAGPQHPEFAHGAPWHVRTAEIHRARSLPEGAETDWAATNNVLIDLEAVRLSGLRFDARFSMFGEDMFFFRTLTASTGRKIRWTNEARVHEEVIAERQTLEWAVGRSIRYGRTNAAVDTLADGRLRAGINAVRRAAWLLARAAIRIPAAATGMRSRLDPVTDAAQAAGYLAGLARIAMPHGEAGA